MDAKAYAYIRKGEDSWWYRGRETAVAGILQKVPPAAGGRVLDYGAGFGAMHAFLGRYGRPEAFEIEPTAAESCRTRGYGRVATSHNELDQPSIYSLIGSFDVLEHLKDDRTAIRKIYEMLEPGGVFIATVPAFQFLWSFHDDLHHHFRRYRLPHIERLFREAGFLQVRGSYWNMILFPAAFTLRLFGVGAGESLKPATPINWLLTYFLKLESAAIPYTSLPFGISIVIAGRKPANTSSAMESAPRRTLRTLLNPIYLFATMCKNRLAHFLSVGATGALLNIGITWFFATFVFGEERYREAFLIGIAGNLIYNFTLNSIVTFRTKRRHLRRFVIFLLYSLLQATTLYYMAAFATSLIGVRFYLPIISTLIIAFAFINFLVFKLAIFKE
jgi:putative flippase GtrA/SAM-dependent methyltransferase